ncbi:MAG: copper chaperone PCu(A)C [Pseudomonadota bacterium]
MKRQTHPLKWVQNRALRLIIVAVSMLITSAPLSAGEFNVGDLKIEQAWSRATPKGAKVGAGYLKITNTGAKPDRLVSAAAKFAGRVEIHEMSMDGGIMRMRRLTKGVVIPPGKAAVLKPGGNHLMFIELNAPIVKDQPFSATLEFEKAGKIEVTFQVAGIGASAPDGSKAGSHSGAMKRKAE